METITISVSPKLLKLGKDIQIRDIGSQLSQLLYGDGKKLSTGPAGIIGQSQNVLVKQNGLADKTIIVKIPSGCETFDMYPKVISMINHAKKNKVLISYSIDD